jgi:hypothetical protein
MPGEASYRLRHHGSLACRSCSLRSGWAALLPWDPLLEHVFYDVWMARPRVSLTVPPWTGELDLWGRDVGGEWWR